ncbi:cell wall-binding repeat-containing protein [Arthrobacter sp. JSM 101049]|uniref:cell wall-binding repeat-containing protein n=1 Tax=Arthrobacter sp. JSM 101049 TaxID=929097 RepID=UPI0035613BE3
MPERRSLRPRITALALAASLAIPLAGAGAAGATPVEDDASTTASPAARGTVPETSPEAAAKALLNSALEPATPETSRQKSAKPKAEPKVDPQAASKAAQAIESELKSDQDVHADERVELSEKALDAVGIEALDAQLGQGLRRIEESGDPQAPTVEELEMLGEATAELAETSPEAPAASDEPAAAPAGAFAADTAIYSASTQGAFSATPTALAVPASWEDLRTWRPPGVLGVDVSHHQGDVNWSYTRSQGVRFAYMKATQSWPSGVYKDPRFSQNYSDSYNRGMIRGAYHFAMPAHSSGATQAKEFMANGGGWSADGKTLPPLLDIEWNPYSSSTYPAGKGDDCYGMTPRQMVSWIKDFGATIKASTGRLPMIYTARAWWDECTGDSTAFKSWPLHVAMYPKSDVPENPRELPEGWTTFNMWQYTSNANLIGSGQNTDANVWNGDLTSLRDFARNRRSTPYRLTTDYLGNGDVWPTRMAPVRIYGSTRFDTPVKISRRTFPSGASTVVIASGENFPDALAGSPLATLKNAPLLLTRKNSLPSSVASELKRLDPDRIIVLGGPIAVSNATVSALRAYGPVQRVAGNNLYDTSSKIAGNWNSASTVFVATGERFEDAMSLAAVAADRKAPMLLTRKSAVPSTTLNQLKRLKPSRVYLAGGTLTISDAAVAQIRRALPNARVVRYGGRTLYDTSALIAKAFWSRGSQRQFIATGSDFPDGLTGAVMAGYNGAPLLLTRKTCMPSSVSKALVSMEGWTNVLLGGPLVLDSDVAYKDGGEPNVC